jgi:glycosyltransferase involved in cell wall biosynthesis
VVAAPRDGPFFARFEALGVRTVELRAHSFGFAPLLATRRLIRDLGVHVVHTHGKGPGLYGRLAARWTGVPAIHTFHGIHYAGYPRVAQWIYLALERDLARLSHTIINVSAEQEGEGLRLRLFDRSRSLTIVNGIDVAELDLAIAQSPIRRETLGLSAADPVVGSVTRFDPIKRVEVLIRGVQALADRFPRVALVLVGGGAEEERIRRLVADLGLRDRVIFTGLLENPGRIYPALDVYAATSLKEGLPLSLVEAMAAGLAVVATDVPGHREVITPETGVLVPPEDRAALADAIAALLRDPARRRALGAAARRRVLEAFALEPMVSRTADVYRRAAAGVAP